MCCLANVPANLELKGQVEWVGEVGVSVQVVWSFQNSLVPHVAFGTEVAKKNSRNHNLTLDT